MPKTSELVHFDRDAYFTRLCQMSNYELQIKEREKRRNRIGAGAGLGASVAAALFTAGASLIGGVVSGRILHIENEKLYLIQYELWRRQVPPLEATAKDWFIPFGSHMGGIMMAGGLGMGLEHAVAPVAVPGVHAVVNAGMTHPVQTSLGNAAQGAASGATHVFHCLSTAAHGQVANATWAPQGGPMYTTGAYVGQWGTEQAMQWGADNGTEWATKHAADYFADRHHPHPHNQYHYR